MAEYGLIKDTTLTALADGFRDTGIVQKYKKVPKATHYKTMNATSLTDPTPTQRQETEKITILPTGNTQGYEVVIDFAIWESPATANPSTWIGSISCGGSNNTLSIYRNTQSPVSFKFNTTSAFDIDFSSNPYTHNTQDWYGATITVFYLDAAGNYILADSDELVEYTPTEMAEAITNFDMPVALPEEAFTITGDCTYRFAYDGWNWFIGQYGNKITTDQIVSCDHMFYYSSTLENIPFTINLKELTGSSATKLSNIIANTFALKVCPKIRGKINWNSSNTTLESLCYSIRMLRDAEDLLTPEMTEGFSTFKCTSSYSMPRLNSIFSYCQSLRKVPSWFFNFKLNPESTAFPASSYAIYGNAFTNCNNLDEVVNVPVWVCKAAQTSNMFSSSFNNTSRLKAFTFETVDGQPIVTQWKTQTIDLSTYVGYVQSSYNAVGYNSGITADKAVTDDATYQALKNDPDWFTAKIEYSRYNHDSAVETINSLPDTSAYLASAGGTNTIKFKKAAGSLTDGGSIANLTAEEIAVATAKGWTVTLS
jgi:hypothetical protein